MQKAAPEFEPGIEYRIRYDNLGVRQGMLRELLEAIGCTIVREGPGGLSPALVTAAHIKGATPRFFVWKAETVQQCNAYIALYPNLVRGFHSSSLLIGQVYADQAARREGRSISEREFGIRNITHLLEAYDRDREKWRLPKTDTSKFMPHWQEDLRALAAEKARQHDQNLPVRLGQLTRDIAAFRARYGHQL